MAALLNFILSIFFTLNVVLESELVGALSKPDSLVQHIIKDNTTNLHVANIRKRTPQVSVPLLVDLNGGFLWVSCDENYLSTTYSAPLCHSTQCALAINHHCHKCSSPERPGCHNNTCAVIATNPITYKNVVGELGQDVILFQSISKNRSIKSNKWVSVPHFLFACAPSSLLQGSALPQGVRGVFGLGHSSISPSTQLNSRLGFEPQFSLCLSTNDDKNGWVSFGNRIPSIGHPINLSYTPLSIGARGEYFIPVRSIIINYKNVQLNSSLLSRTRAFGGTMISTTTPWTILKHSVYEEVIKSYAAEMKGVPQVRAISPFGLCFNSRYLPPTRVGTPNIDLVFQNRNVTWRIFGVDAVLRIQPDVACLTFVNGGNNTRAAITIGSYHLENVLLHFDLSRSRLGFNPNRLTQPTRCSEFNFNVSQSISLLSNNHNGVA